MSPSHNLFYHLTYSHPYQESWLSGDRQLQEHTVSWYTICYSEPWSAKI